MATNSQEVLRTVWALARGGRYEDGRQLLMNHLGHREDDADAWLLLSKLSLSLRDAPGAVAAARRASQWLPTHADAAYTLGRALRAAGDDTAAETCYRQALQLDPKQPDVLTSLGTLLRRRGGLQEAIVCYRRALALDAQHVEAANNLGNALIAQGEDTEARRLHEISKPALAAALNELRNFADVHLAAGQVDKAFGALTEAVRLAPDQAELWLLAGQLASATGQSQTGLEHVERAALLDAGQWEAHEIARRMTVAAGLRDRALVHTAHAQSLVPSADAVLAAQLSLPGIQSSRESIAASREGYARGLQEALVSDEVLHEPTSLVGRTTFFVASHPAFYLAYHGENNREFQRHLAGVFLKRLPGLGMVAAHCAGPRRAGRLRIGFISRFLSDHSIGKTSRGLIERLDKTRFEVFVLRITPSADDATTRSIRAAAEHTIDLATTLADARQQIAALELDVLFYQDIGMEPMSYFLAFARLAPVQCVSFGHPDTTGIPTMDYFVSNDRFECDGAQAHYSERLFLLQGLPTLAYYHRPTLPVAPAPRAQFGLDDADILYLCPQTLFKLHPDFDELMLGILRRDPRAVIAFVDGEFKDYATALEARFARTLAGLAPRIRFLPRLAHAAFLQLLRCADVILDTVHFNGMNSSLEAFAVGTPVVTLPGNLQRSRHTQAMYRHMGIEDTIAMNADSYVDIAVRLGTDPSFAASVRQRIRDRSHLLFEDERVVQEFERFFETVTEARLIARRHQAATSPGHDRLS